MPVLQSLDGSAQADQPHPPEQTPPSSDAVMAGGGAPELPATGPSDVEALEQPGTRVKSTCEATRQGRTRIRLDATAPLGRVVVREIHRATWRPCHDCGLTAQRPKRLAAENTRDPHHALRKPARIERHGD